MALRLVQVNIKAGDDAALGRFWADALGWSLDSEEPGVTNLVPENFTWPDPSAVCIDLVRVPDPETVDYRVRLELATASATEQEKLVARLTELGARAVDTGRAHPGDVALADPEGNVFSVLGPRSLYQDTGPIGAVVVECEDPRALAEFWDAAMDWTLHEVSDDLARFRSGQGVGPYLEFRRRDGEELRRGRIHLDVMPYAGDDQGTEVDRLRGLGATDVDLGQGDVSWAVLADPAGNEFCVLRSRGERIVGEPAAS
ncbi:VOC family protein [Catenulispora yoronensis]|uniref:VOC family protein n=1 Tax=Catenulispora yoronensis TaxID=450799 RepID=A0ABP5G3Y5_9ACTN